MSIDAGTVLAQVSTVLEEGEMDVVRIHDFELDGDKHDDDAIERLHRDFEADFDTVTTVLDEHYGASARSGDNEDGAIPLAGVVAWNI